MLIYFLWSAALIIWKPVFESVFIFVSVNIHQYLTVCVCVFVFLFLQAMYEPAGPQSRSWRISAHAGCFCCDFCCSQFLSVFLSLGFCCLCLALVWVRLVCYVWSGRTRLSAFSFWPLVLMGCGFSELASHLGLGWISFFGQSCFL